MSIANSGYSTASAASAYQTSGKPLSKEAIYKAKLKAGAFQSPATKNTGFSNATAASDTAALLAASSDLTIEPYRRTTASDAQTAALLAKEDAPGVWTRDSVAVEAQSAASNARITKAIEETRSTKNQGSAASAALHLSARSIASSSITSKNLESLYEFDAVRNGTKRPDHALNLSKITERSKKNAAERITERTNPEKDVSRSGLASRKRSSAGYAVGAASNAGYELAQTDDVHAELSTFAASGALASSGFKLPEEEPIPDLANFAASGALASQGYKVPEDPNLEAKAVRRNQMIDPKVLAAASLKASNTLKGIDKELGEKHTLLYNADYNKIAYEIAQKQSAARAADPNNGKINLGGGLYMTQAELDNIASKHVNPVIADINKKADAQRAKDAEVLRIQNEQKQAHEEFKQQEKAKKLEEKRLKEEEKIKRRKELEDEKQKQIQAKKELEELKKQELEKTKEILQTKQLEGEKRKNELIAEKEAEQERLSQEAAEAEAKRKEELTGLETDRDAQLAPILKDLDTEAEKLALLEQERKAVEDITNSQITNIANSKALMETSHKELIDLEEQLKNLQLDIEKATSEEEKLTKEKEISEKETEIALQKHKDEELEKEHKRLELEKEKNDVEHEKLNLLLDLENEKIDALHDEKKILETLPPHGSTVVTGKGPLFVGDKPVVGEGEDKLEKTFTGFSQGSDDEKEVNDNKKKRKSFFKEFF